jgi:hypothetical protein
MSVTYTVTLTDAQDKAFRHIALDPQFWLENVFIGRAKTAVEDIAKAEIDRKIEAGEPITGSKEDLVLAADIKSVEQMNAEDLAARQAENAASQQNPVSA